MGQLDEIAYHVNDGASGSNVVLDLLCWYLQANLKMTFSMKGI